MPYSLTPDLALQSVGDHLSAVSATIRNGTAPLSKYTNLYHLVPVDGMAVVSSFYALIGRQ